jgi:hypothetical protein
MPNWSFNSLKISGNRSDMSELYNNILKEEVDSEVFRFSNVFPMPSKIKNTISPSSSALGRKWMDVDVNEARNSKIDGILEGTGSPNLIPIENNTPEKCDLLRKEFGVDNWYDWNVKTYGTKWDIFVGENEFTKSETEFSCSFDTAWSPPINFITKLQKKFPKVDIEIIWELEGSDSCGRFYTQRDGEGNWDLVLEEDEVSYESGDGREIYFSDDEWRYADNNEVCDDAHSVSPFNK